MPHPFDARSLLSLSLLAACSASPHAVPADSGAPLVDLPAEEASVPPAPDVPAAFDVPAAPDVPPALDVPAGEASVAPDVPAPDSGRACVPTAARGGEATDALCANGLDDDCDGYVDCRDFDCSHSTSVTVCGRADAGVPPPTDVPVPVDDTPTAPGVVGPHGGSVDVLRFAAFGDVRPPSDNATAAYPSAIFGSVIDGIAAQSPQFVIGTGDYMFAGGTNTFAVNAQIDLLLAAEARFGGQFFHAMGNHECTGASASNCPLGNETANARGFHARLAPAYATPYYDFVVQTSRGDAHFIVTAPNAWSPTQQAWLTRVLARSALYTIVVAHEPPDAREAPGTMPIEAQVAARPGGVTMRLYGHYHEFSHRPANLFITGNAGAPLASATGSYGFVSVTQRADGNLVVTAYDIGRPPMVAASFVLTPGGALTR